MTVYGSEHAALYDLFHGEKDYAGEARFVDELAHDRPKAPSAPSLLDAACGTGRHASEFLALGYEVTGFDRSEAMVERARIRCPGATFLIGDLAEYDLGKRFDVVTCLFDSLGYLVTNERILRGLRNLKAQLASAGLLVLEVWHAAAMLRKYEPVRYRSWFAGDEQVIRISRTALDARTQTGRVCYRTLRLKDSALVGDWSEEHINRFFGLQEIDGLLRAAELRAIASFGGFDVDAPIDVDAWHLVIAAEHLSREPSSDAG